MNKKLAIIGSICSIVGLACFFLVDNSSNYNQELKVGNGGININNASNNSININQADNAVKTNESFLGNWLIDFKDGRDDMHIHQKGNVKYFFTGDFNYEGKVLATVQDKGVSFELKADAFAAGTWKATDDQLIEKIIDTKIVIASFTKDNKDFTELVELMDLDNQLKESMVKGFSYPKNILSKSPDLILYEMSSLNPESDNLIVKMVKIG